MNTLATQKDVTRLVFLFFTTERLEILDHEAAAHTVLNRDWVAILWTYSHRITCKQTRQCAS